MAEINVNKALIYNIQRFCLKDGGGIRTVVFFKGCPLSCLWCCNPESQSFKKEIMYNQFICRGCQNCINTCKQNAIVMIDNKIQIDNSKCILCGECEDSCYFDALNISGKEMTVDQVYDLLTRDKDYYNITNGGVTLSGGECTSQYEFVIKLITKLKRKNISVAIETCGYCETDKFLKIVSVCEEVYFDIKLLDNKNHINYTGVGNELILNNLSKIKDKSNIVIRVPLIKNINMNNIFMDQLISLVNDFEIEKVELLPYHELGVAKYAQFRRDYECCEAKTPNNVELKNFIELFKKESNAHILVL